MTVAARVAAGPVTSTNQNCCSVDLKIEAIQPLKKKKNFKEHCETGAHSMVVYF